MVALTVTPGEILHNKFGRYRHEDMIGMKYGSKVCFKSLRTRSLPHMTISPWSRSSDDPDALSSSSIRLRLPPPPDSRTLDAFLASSDPDPIHDRHRLHHNATGREGGWKGDRSRNGKWKYDTFAVEGCRREGVCGELRISRFAMREGKVSSEGLVVGSS